MAAARGHTEVVGVLLAADADVHVQASADGVIDSPLSIAGKRGHFDVVELIERAGGESLKP
jgi:ankyrin repeat protein